MTTRPRDVAGIFYDVTTDTEHLILTGTRQHDDAMEWCQFHGIDPHKVLAGSVIQRDASMFSIVWTEVVYNEAGELVLDRTSMEPVTRVLADRGEAPPLPFPPSFTEGVDQ